MKKLLILFIFILNLSASEPISNGAFYGNYKFSMNKIFYEAVNFTEVIHVGNLNAYEIIPNSKNKSIKYALNYAKNMAKKQNKKYYAIDNITHEVSSMNGE